MFFKLNVACILAALTIFHGQVQGSPAAANSDGGDLVILSTQETPTGTITIWGVPDGSSSSKRTEADSASVPIKKRQCGTNNVTCSGSHTADRNACLQLVGSLSANSGQGVGVAPRSICQTVNGNQCCVSWANPVSGLTQGQLVNSANDVLNDCSGNDISGLTRNTNLNGICTTQCLSNRPSGCAN
ncbi:hypothetical protein FB45DRAFT_759295 [Roridomyces roridus]|uniref:WD-like domain-containing protein n=1 Tax=Roridomyces roridus TaxID=1738132 RepID=A0AAD7B815_9AGAR|nr:hypothetical protein FB45DRAFT_759295 [Roridomyces roridus]